jgi:hypothetical protein
MITSALREREAMYIHCASHSHNIQPDYTVGGALESGIHHWRTFRGRRRRAGKCTVIAIQPIGRDAGLRTLEIQAHAWTWTGSTVIYTLLGISTYSPNLQFPKFSSRPHFESFSKFYRMKTESLIIVFLYSPAFRNFLPCISIICTFCLYKIFLAHEASIKRESVYKALDNVESNHEPRGKSSSWHLQAILSERSARLTKFEIEYLFQVSQKDIWSDVINGTVEVGSNGKKKVKAADDDDDKLEDSWPDEVEFLKTNCPRKTCACGVDDGPHLGEAPAWCPWHVHGKTEEVQKVYKPPLIAHLCPTHPSQEFNQASTQSYSVEL